MSRDEELWSAVYSNNVSRVKKALERGADPNASEFGQKPLHHACRWGHVEVVRLLIEKGAALNAKDSDGYTPFDLATQGNQAEVVQFLNPVKKEATVIPTGQIVEQSNALKQERVQISREVEVNASLREELVKCQSLRDEAVKEALNQLTSHQKEVSNLTQLNDDLNKRVVSLESQLEVLKAANKTLEEAKAAQKEDERRKLDDGCVNLTSISQRSTNDGRSNLTSISQRSLDDRRVNLASISPRPPGEQASFETEKALWQTTLSDTQRELDEHKKHQEELRLCAAREQAFLEDLNKLINRSFVSLAKKEQDFQKKQEEVKNIPKNQPNWRQKEEQLTLQLRQLKNEKSVLEEERESLKNQQQAVNLRIYRLVEDGRKILQDAKGLDQLKKSVEETKQELDGREKEWKNCQERAEKAEKEWKNKQERAEKAEKEFLQAQKVVVEHAGLLVERLQSFKQHRQSPQEKAFQTFLTEVKQMFKSKGVTSPSCFISYAWEDIGTTEGKANNETIQQWVTRLEGDLRKLNVDVITSMHSHIRETISQNITKSDLVFIIGTAHFKCRVEDGLPQALQECMACGDINALKGHLEGVKRGPTGNPNYDIINPTTNVAFEFAHIWAKASENRASLIPLLFSGDQATAFPTGISEFFIYTATGPYHHLLTASTHPVGLIPLVFRVHSEHNGLCGVEYQTLLEKFELRIGEIE